MIKYSFLCYFTEMFSEENVIFYEDIRIFPIKMSFCILIKESELFKFIDYKMTQVLMVVYQWQIDTIFGYGALLKNHPIMAHRQPLAQKTLFYSYSQVNTLESQEKLDLVLQETKIMCNLTGCVNVCGRYHYDT